MAVALAAPAMAVTAEYYYTTSAPIIGSDTATAHYTIYTQQSDTATVDSLAQWCAAMEYEVFLATVGTGVDPDGVYENTAMERWAVSTPYEYGVVSPSSIFALWVYHNGSEPAQFMVIQAADLGYAATYGGYIFAQAVDVTGHATQAHSPWTYFAPEPATATLSLLALAGLAAHRKRRSENPCGEAANLPEA